MGREEELVKEDVVVATEGILVGGVVLTEDVRDPRGTNKVT